MSQKHSSWQEMINKDFSDLDEGLLQDLLSNEEFAWAIVINNELENVISRLDDESARRLRVFEKKFWDILFEKSVEISEILSKNMTADARFFAEFVARPHPAGPALFASYKQLDATVLTSAKSLIRQLRRRTRSSDEARILLGDPDLKWML